MNSDEIHYHLTGLPGLKELLKVVTEIKSETGMVPDVIKYRDGRQLVYNPKDAKCLESGMMNEDTYIRKNIIPQISR